MHLVCVTALGDEHQYLVLEILRRMSSLGTYCAVLMLAVSTVTPDQLYFRTVRVHDRNDLVPCGSLRDHVNGQNRFIWCLKPWRALWHYGPRTA